MPHADRSVMIADEAGNPVFPSPIAAGETHVGQVGGHTVISSTSFTRPNDTATYASGDVVANSTSVPVVMTFANCARLNAGSGIILSALLIDGSNPTLKGDFELWLFRTSPAIDNDNALWTPTDAELATLVKVIVFGSAPTLGDATVGAVGNCVYDAPGVNQAFVCGAGVKTLFGVLVVRNALVGIALNTYTALLNIAQD